MAIEQNIPEPGKPWFIGEDKKHEVTIFQADGITPQDVTGWVLRWELRKRPEMTALITKTSPSGGIAISGTYNVNPALNTQLVTVTIVDTETDPLSAGVFHYALKRMDADNETVLSFGLATLTQAAVA